MPCLGGSLTPTFPMAGAIRTSSQETYVPPMKREPTLTAKQIEEGKLFAEECR